MVEPIVIDSDELSDKDIHPRDKYQFELKTEYAPHKQRKVNTYTLEFYFFLPEPLQINPSTYPKDQFYHDQTSFLRYKTPEVSLKHLVDAKRPDSPLYHIEKLLEHWEQGAEKLALRELKLYANIARSNIRNRANHLVQEPNEMEIEQLAKEIRRTLDTFREMLDALREKKLSKQMHEQVRYVDEFLSRTLFRYCLPLLYHLHHQEPAIQELLTAENHYRQGRFPKIDPGSDEQQMEHVVYRSGLLKKFVWEVLFLPIQRKNPSRQLRELVAAMAAGVAMVVYLWLLSFYRIDLVVDSVGFITFATLLYIMKDRLKEGMKAISTRFVSRWFPDYSTKIFESGGTEVIGILHEFVSFLGPEKIPEEIRVIRNTEFHTDLEEVKRREQVLYYKKEVKLTPKAKAGSRLHALNDIVRFNISKFLDKLSDARVPYYQYDLAHSGVQRALAPKVYHMNIIMKKTTNTPKTPPTLSKYRVILDKEGIKRVEKLQTT